MYSTPFSTRASGPCKGLLKRLCLIASFALSMPSAAVTNDAESFGNDFDARVNALLDQHALPGLVLSVRHQGQDVHFQSYGKVNVDKTAPMHDDAIFRIYSMSKPITALALLQLVDRGMLALNDNIRQYLPDIDPFEIDGVEQEVTVHHLLSHTAGFGYGGGLRNWIDIRYLLANPLSRNNSTAEMMDDISGIDLKFTPGARFEYSIASDIQGALIEAITNMPLDEYLRQHVFTPLEMIDTGFYVPEKDQHRLVDMYEYDATTFEEAYVYNRDKILFTEKGANSDYLEEPTLKSGGGGLVSTAADYTNFVSMLLNGGEFKGQRLLSSDLIERMLSSHTSGLDTHFMPRVYRGTGFGYGVGIKEISGDTRSRGTFFWGGMGGTIFWADPDKELQVVGMMQVEDGWIALEKWLIEEIYQQLPH